MSEDYVVIVVSHSMVRSMRCHSSTFEYTTCCFNLFFLVCYSSFYQHFFLPPRISLSFGFVYFFFPDPCVVLSLRLSHSSLSYISVPLILYVNRQFSCCKRSIPRAACGSQSSIVCEAKTGGNPKRDCRYINRFILSCSRTHTTTASSSISMENLGTHNHCAHPTIGTLI